MQAKLQFNAVYELPDGTRVGFTERTTGGVPFFTVLVQGRERLAVQLHCERQPRKSIEDGFIQERELQCGIDSVQGRNSTRKLLSPRSNSGVSN